MRLKDVHVLWRKYCGHTTSPNVLWPQGAQGRDGRDRRGPRPGEAREGGARGPPPVHDLHGGRRAAFRPLRAVQPLPRLRLVRRRARRVPQLPRDDHYAHADRELELGRVSPLSRILAGRGRHVVNLSCQGRLRLRLVTSRGPPYPSRSPRAHPSGWTRTHRLASVLHAAR